MPKNALFLEKAVKFAAAAVGAPPSSPRWPPVVGAPHRPRVLLLLFINPRS